MDLIQLYTHILVALGHQIDTNGNVRTLGIEADASDAVPTAIEGKSLVLPTPAYRQLGRWNEFVAFHPLSESILRGESKVHKWLRERMCERIAFVGATTILALLEAAADPNCHAAFTEQERGVLSILSEVDSKTVTDFGKVVQALASGGMFRFVNLYVTRKGDLMVTDASGQSVQTTFNRTAYVTFPFMDELRNSDYVVCGVKMRKRDIAMLQQLMMSMFPGCENTNHYSFGTNSMVAPHFHAMLLAFINVYNPLNTFAWLYRRLLDGIPNIFVDLNWTQNVAQIDQYVNAIVALPDNEGDGGPADGTSQGRATNPIANIPSQPVFTSNIGQPASPAVAPMNMALPGALPAAPQPVIAPLAPGATGQVIPGVTPLGQPLKDGVVAKNQQRMSEWQNAQQQYVAAAQMAGGFQGFAPVQQAQPMMMQPQPPMMMQAPMYGQPMMMAPQMMMQAPMMMPQAPMMQQGFPPVGMAPAGYSFQQPQMNMMGRV